MPSLGFFRALRPFLIAAIALLVAGFAFADAVPGFLESWPMTGLGGWGGGSQYSNPGSGGALGASDGYLRMSTATVANLAATTSAPAYIGNWVSAGVTGVDVMLNDVDADQPLEIHFVIGSGATAWLYTPAFLPPEQAWGQFSVDLTATASFVRIMGTASLAQVLQAVDRIQFRHDLAPFVQAPDPIQADVGIDELLLQSAPTHVAPYTWGRIKALYAR